MPRPRSRFGGVRGRVARRETLWIGGVDNGFFTGLGAGATVLFGSLNAAALALRPFTVVRTRGILSVQTDQTANSEEGALAFGAAIVSDQASAIGITAVPTPITDQSSDLFFTFQFAHWGILVSSAVGIVSPTITSYAFDSKAMRKVEDGDDLVQVLENESSTAGCQFKLSLRHLLKLH